MASIAKLNPRDILLDLRERGDLLMFFCDIGFVFSSIQRYIILLLTHEV